jgi:hypothetical protein
MMVQRSPYAPVDVPLAPSPLASSGSFGTLGFVEGPQWNQIKRHLYPAEVSTVRRLVGENLIRETKLAWQELNSLRQMLKDFQEQNDVLSDAAERTAAEREKLFQNPQRDLLKQQARLLLDDVQKQEATGGKSLKDLLADKQDTHTAEFVLGRSLGDGDEQCPSRPPSGLGGYPQTPSTRPSSRSTTRPSTGASEDRVGGQPFALGRQLGEMELQTVADGIKEALQEELQALLSAIEEQNHLLEAEACIQAQAYARAKASDEPSTAEIRQLVHRLQSIITSPGFQVHSMNLPRRPEGSFSGGGRVRMLQTLIQQSRREAAEASAVDEEPESPPASPMALGQQSQSTSKVAAAVTAPAAPRKLDPFFDDPFG